jgi:hypothetical protein
MFTNKNPFFSVGVDYIQQYPFALEFNLKSTRLTENGLCLISNLISIEMIFFLGRFAPSCYCLR